MWLSVWLRVSTAGVVEETRPEAIDDWRFSILAIRVGDIEEISERKSFSFNQLDPTDLHFASLFCI